MRLLHPEQAERPPAPGAAAMRHLTPTVALVAALTLAGCGGGDKPAAKPTVTPTIAALTPSPTPQTASVQQYASAVAPTIKSIRDTWQKYQDNGCATGSQQFACALAPMTFDANAQTIALTLTGAAKPGVPAYIGPPPAELEKLVADTLTAAQQTDNAIGDDTKIGPGVYLAVSSLMSTLDKWDPYL